MLKLLRNFLKNVNVLSNVDKTLEYFCLFNTTYSAPLFALYNMTQKDFYNIKINKKLNWRLKKNDKKDVNRCYSFRTDQSCYNRK